MRLFWNLFAKEKNLFQIQIIKKKKFQLTFFMETHAKAVVIGGGWLVVPFCFIWQNWWKDVVLLERNELISRGQWHAAGQIHTISSDPI
ncbi:MAG: hypothetical protein CM1200mP30_33360 [Pseudomonadota bacterium]|nr:MAG: hypothetical protein CM1200mP30_33360 [Pseudomonadota bacterium]